MLPDEIGSSVESVISADSVDNDKQRQMPVSNGPSAEIDREVGSRSSREHTDDVRSLLYLNTEGARRSAVEVGSTPQEDDGGIKGDFTDDGGMHPLDLDTDSARPKAVEVIREVSSPPPENDDSMTGDVTDDDETNLLDLDADGARRKAVEISEAVAERDVPRLRELARSAGGLLNDELRRQAWPLLVALPARPPPEQLCADEATLTGHVYYRQVELDVQRTLTRFPPGIADTVRLGLQDSLVRLIMEVLCRRPQLHYYQGYHDVAITVLLACGLPLALDLLEQLSCHQLRPFMHADMQPTCDLLSYILALLEREDGETADFLQRSDAGLHFALPWLITWFSHVLPHYRLIVRLFDYVLATHRLSPVYLAAAVVLHRRHQLLAADCELSAVHVLLSRLPARLPWQQLLEATDRLLHAHPPHQLQTRVDAINQQRRRAEQSRPRRRTAASTWRRWALVGAGAALTAAVLLQLWNSTHS